MHSIIDTKDAGGVRADGSLDTTATDRYCEHMVEDFMRKGYKSSARTRDFHPTRGLVGCSRRGKVVGGRAGLVRVSVTIRDGKVIRDGE